MGVLAQARTLYLRPTLNREGKARLAQQRGGRDQMDVSQLSKLGRVAGVPGIALGAVVLLLGAVMTATNTLPDGWRGPALIIIILGSILLGVLAVLGWISGARGNSQIARTEGDDSPAQNRDKTKAGGPQHASTVGAKSPASNVRQ